VNFLIEYIEKFEGIIGALLGVVVTLITTQLLKNIGKVNFYLVKDDFKFTKNIKDEIGQTYPEECNKQESDCCVVDFVIELYNNSDTNKILRDIRIGFYNKNKLQLSVIPYDKITKRSSAHWVTYDELLNVNIPAKQIIKIEILKYLRDDDISLIKNSDSVFLEMKNHNGKRYKFKVKSI
jgi:predicted small secreted protein